MDAVELLKSLVRIPSVSRDEKAKADFLYDLFESEGMKPSRLGNNIYCMSGDPGDGRPVIMLNSHIDTVKPAAAWTRDPFAAEEQDGRIFGLGSNDAHASVVSLYSAFRRLSATTQAYNLILALSCEEEVSGKGGMEALIRELPRIDFAIVGEPTSLDLAIAEKGLMVLDCEARGVAGHAARNTGVNAIYEAADDIAWFRSSPFEKTSPLLGRVNAAVTMIEAGSQHNVIPDNCKYVVDVRLNELYTHEQALELIRANVKAEVRPRSTRLKPSSVSPGHPFVQRYQQIAKGKLFGSATMSDQALIPYPSVKLGPGDSNRSHMADEFIALSEIREGEELYVRLLDGFLPTQDCYNPYPC